MSWFQIFILDFYDCVLFISRSVMKALRCPFLTRVSVNQITQNARSLLTNHVGSCPVMARMMSTMELASIAPDQGKILL